MVANCRPTATNVPHRESHAGASLEAESTGMREWRCGAAALRSQSFFISGEVVAVKCSTCAATNGMCLLSSGLLLYLPTVQWITSMANDGKGVPMRRIIPRPATNMALLLGAFASMQCSLGCASPANAQPADGKIAVDLAAVCQPAAMQAVASRLSVK